MNTTFMPMAVVVVDTADDDHLKTMFEKYIEETMDPGWSLIVGSLIACILLFSFLPCMVSLGSRYERQKQNDDDDGDDDVSRRDGPSTDNDRSSNNNDDDKDNNISDGNRIVTNPRPSKELSIRDLGPIVRDWTPTSTTAGTLRGQRDTIVTGESRRKMCSIKEERDGIEAAGSGTWDMAETEATRNAVADRTGISKKEDVTIMTTTITDMIVQAHPTTNATTPPSRVLEDGIIDCFCGVAEALEAAQIARPRSQISMRRSTSSLSESCRSSSRRNTKSGRSGQKDDVTGGDEETSVPGRFRSKRKRRRQTTSDSSRHTSNPRSSVVSRLHHDDVSFNEAVDKYKAPCPYRLPTGEEGLGEIDILYGEYAWWRPKMIVGAFDRLVGIADFDDEMMIVLKTALSSSFHGFWTGLFNLMDVWLVGLIFGTENATVFVLVSLLTWLTTTFNYGFCEALAKLLPAALEVDDAKLAGTYLSTSITLFTVGMSIVGMIWSFLTRKTFLWLGFDDETAYLAQQYAYTQIGLEWVTGVGYCIHLFLDLTGHDRYSTIANMTFGVGQTMAVILQISTGEVNLVHLGMCRAALAAFHVLGSSLIVFNLGWLDEYVSGILSIPRMDRSAIMAVSSVAWPLGFLIFLSYGEWELLIFFAKALGPAEVVSWAMLGYIWSMLKYLSDGIADAAESRCAIHLVLNQPERARLAAYKSNFLGFVTSIVTTSILFMASIGVTEWISQDATLQRLMIETFPLIGIGNVVRSIGIVSASVLGTHGRAGIANLMQFLGIWCITIPLSAIFTYGLQIDLQGLTTAVVLGLALSGAGNTYLLLRSDWIAIASTVSEGFVLDHDPNQGGGG